MPYKYTSQGQSPGAYHVFNRARDGIWLFRDDEDRRHFERLINRHLSAVPQLDSRGRPYESLRDEVRMCARNVLSSHFHLILWQKVPGGIDRLMNRVLAAYTRYYHRKYGTSGPLYAGRFRRRMIESDKSFMWRVGYVHDNHKREGLDYRFSTHKLLISGDAPSWLEAEATLKVFGGLSNYQRYMEKRIQRNTLDDQLRQDGTLF